MRTAELIYVSLLEVYIVHFVLFVIFKYITTMNNYIEMVSVYKCVQWVRKKKINLEINDWGWIAVKIPSNPVAKIWCKKESGSL